MATAAPSLVWLGSQERVRSIASEQRVALFALAAVLALGCAVRFIGLDAAALHNNELNHYYVTRSLQNGGQPLLPSGEWYGRGLEYSRMVALAVPWLRPAELAVRLPAAVFGCMAVFIFAFLSWRLARPHAALYATLLFAVYPPLVELSRFGRFYTLQIVLGLIAMFAGWQAIRNGPQAERTPFGLLQDWGWILLAGIALAVAARIQIVTLSVALGLALAVSIRAGHGLRAWRWNALRHSMPVQLSLLGILALVSLLAAMPETIALLAGRARNVPFWARAGGENVSSYFAFLAGSLPLLAIGGAAALYWVIRRYGMLGVYLALWFGVPFIIHSMLPWKAGRFIILAVPALILMVGIATGDLLGALTTRMRGTLARLRVPAAAAGAGARMMAASLAIAAITPLPAIRIAAWLQADPSAGWREALTVAQSMAGTQSIPIGHSLPLPALHYWAASTSRSTTACASNGRLPHASVLFSA